ncbi:OmpA family protein [Alphaproteobacteria bacterium KMM 3653]|uniref:OmpA family protein n=1 Tax=Harenicola maris TaxID=2841044 RepID=A0AAP2CPB9_9RHOB|nr:OmpA family protein [Harenicola maris]
MSLGLAVPGAAQTGVRELPISADRCAILHALMGGPYPGCAVPVIAGVTRRIEPGFSRDAAPLEAAGGPKGYFIRFAFNSSRLTPEYAAHVKRLAGAFVAPELSTACIMLVGHTDTVGSANFNDVLSRSRAKQVAEALLQTGQIQSARLRTEGRGERAALAGLDGADPLNRRVEILVRAPGPTGC